MSPRAALPRFSPASLSFLRSMKRNNDREWFKTRKEDYERLVREPMVALIEQLDRDFREFAPDLVASPKVSLFRVYRDTRFSPDKTPLKTNIAAIFPHRDLHKLGCGSLYVQLDAKQLMVAGGIYAPGAADLHAVRAHVASNFSRFRSIVEATAFKRTTGGLQGDQAIRTPRGFVVPDAVAEYLRYKQFLVWKELPASVAVSPRCYPTILAFFRAAAPLVRFLNEPLTRRGAGSLR